MKNIFKKIKNVFKSDNTSDKLNYYTPKAISYNINILNDLNNLIYNKLSKIR